MIVSNSRRGWVNFSSERFMPRLHALLAQKSDDAALPRAKQRIDVVYARSLHGATMGADEKEGTPLDWKVRVQSLARRPTRPARAVRSPPLLPAHPSPPAANATPSDRRLRSPPRFAAWRAAATTRMRRSS